MPGCAHSTTMCARCTAAVQKADDAARKDKNR